MKSRTILIALSCLSAVQISAQSVTKANSSPPQFIRFSGMAGDSRKPMTGIVGITFSLYAEQSGGAALWTETQNVRADDHGHYSTLLGVTKQQGLPPEIFASAQARWVGVQIEGHSELPRVLLVSAPYALKAGDAETLGGLPPSAFMLAPRSAVPGASTSADSNSAQTDSPDATNVTGSGRRNYLPVWTSGSSLGKSVLYESGTAIGINTVMPAATLDVHGTANIAGTLSLQSTGTATATAGNDSQPLALVASTFNSTTGTAVPQTFALAAEPFGNDTAGASGVLSLLYASGSNIPAETGLSISSGGIINFASGQTFPGASGTVTNVGSGAGLTGGPITTSGTLAIASGGVTNTMLTNPSLTVSPGFGLGGGGTVALGGSTTLSVDTNKVPQLNAPNNFGASQSVNGTITAAQIISTAAAGTPPLAVSSTSQVSNLNASYLGGLSAANFQPAGSYATLGQNTFTTTQTVASGDVAINAGNLDLPYTASSSAGVIMMNGSPYIHSYGGNANFFAGQMAGNFSSTGTSNTGVGWEALFSNSSGSNNTAIGPLTLYQNNTGGQNTAVGFYALEANSSGSSNTATGTYALENNTTASGNTANGYFALGDNTTGSENTAVGYQALADGNGSSNTAVGYYALRNVTTGNFNVGIGEGAGENITTTSNSIYIGNPGVSNDSNVIRIGVPGSQNSTYIGGIYGSTASGGIEVFVNSSGQLGTVSSSRRYKEDIRDMGDASSGILGLRPVTFRYKKPLEDGSKPVHYGLIAEEVAEVYPEMVARSASGQIETVKYHELGPMLLNELQKQSATIVAQKEQLRAQEGLIQNQETHIRALEDRLVRIEAAMRAQAIATAAK